ncbi:hypothetical protein ABK040_013494 [Willaertia magna]
MVFGWLFGTGSAKKDKKEYKESAHEKSVQQIQTTIATLEKKEKLLEKKCVDETDKARKLLREENRAAAGLCIKRKKQYEAQIQKIQGQKQNLENMLLSLEEATLNVETLKAQKEASSTLKKAYGGMTADDIADAMDDIRDTMQDANDISEALSQNLSTTVDDEDELMNELEGLESQLHEEKLGSIEIPKEKLTNTTTTIKTKSVKVQEEKDPEEEELEKELEALMV